MIKDIKIPVFVFFATSLILLIGCKSDIDGYEVSNVLLSVDSKTIEFSDDVTSRSVTIKSKGAWNINLIPEWLEVSPLSGMGTSAVFMKVTNYLQSDTTVRGVITLQSDNLTSNIQVSRAPYKFFVPTTELSFGAQDDSRKELFVRSNTVWTIYKNTSNSWCHVSEQSGNGDKTIYVFCDKNNTNQARRDTLQIRTKLDTIFVSIYQSNSDYYVNPSTPTLVFETEGGSQSFTVDSNTDWTQKLLHGGLGSIIRNGNMLTLNVTKNTSPEERFDTILIYTTNSEIKDTAQVYVRQKGLDPVLEIKPESFNPKSLQFGSNSSTGSFSIESNLNWTLTCDKEEWCHITSSKNGTGNGTVNISVDKNPIGATARNAMVTISTSSLTKTVMIQQDAGEEPVLTIVPSSLDGGILDYANTGGIQSFTVQSNIEWSITCSDNSWCHVMAPTGSETGNSEVKVKVDVNPAEASERNCSLRIKSSWFDDKVVSVHQDNGAEGYVRVSSSSLYAKPQGETLSFNIESNLSSWTVSSNKSWCEVKSASGSYNGTVSLSVGLNSGTDTRNATITIKSAISDVIVTVSQEPKAVPGGDDNPNPNYPLKK